MGNICHVNYLHLHSTNEPLKCNSITITDFLSVLSSLKYLLISQSLLSCWPTWELVSVSPWIFLFPH